MRGVKQLPGKRQMKVQKPPNESKVYVTKVSVSLDREEVSGKQTNISCPNDVFELNFLKDELLRSDREKFIALHLNSKNKVISYEIVSIGTLNSSLVHPREVFKAAILANAASIIICHNHPSGDPDPSKEDLSLTQRLVDAGKLLGIEILDHIVFGASNYCSLKETDSSLFKAA